MTTMSGGSGMLKSRVDFQSMPTDELWLLFEDLAATLTERLVAEKSELQDRLRRLNPATAVERAKRRPYTH
jgi:DNA-binding protein H-NS